jgi:hypothetical protein
MASKKLVEGIERGLYAHTRDAEGHGKGAQVEISRRDRTQYSLSIYYVPGMATDSYREFGDLDSLEKAMREFQPDLRQWHVHLPEQAA